MVTIIEDRNNKTRSELTVEDKKISGYSVVNGETCKFDKKNLEIFKEFILSEEKEKIDNSDEYEVFKDKKTNFYHYFKDGKEDFKKFFYSNGELFNEYYDREASGNYRRFNMSNGVIVTICYDFYEMLLEYYL